MVPSAFVMDTPSVSKALFPLAICFVILVSDPVMASIDTSMRSDAYCIFWSSSTEKPVFLDNVSRSSAVVPAL